MKPLVALALLSALSVQAADWPRFRGPGGAGVASDDARPPVEFGPDKNVLWQVVTPAGPSSPCISGGHIFLTAFDGTKLWTIALDRPTGRELWRRDSGAAQIERFLLNQGSPAASTPVTDGTRVISYFGSCGLIAHDFAGKELWRHTLPCAETNNDFGTGTSPILADGLVILVRDLRTDSQMLALDAVTGAPVWKVARPAIPTGYSTPIIWEHDGLKELIAPGGLAMKAYDLRTGADRWIVRELAAVNCGSPVAGDGMLFFAGWAPAGGEDAPMPAFEDLLKADTDADGQVSKAESATTFLKDFFDSNDTDKNGFLTRAEWDGMIAFLKRGKNRVIAVKPGGSGDITSTHVAWEHSKGLPYVPSPLLYRGALFLVKDGGLASSYDAATGTPRYQQKRLGIAGSFYASPVAADGRIYLVNLDGKAATLAAGSEPTVIWQADFKERTAATPAIIGDTLYLRTDSKLFAFRQQK